MPELERYEYEDVKGVVRVDRGASALYGELPDALECVMQGARSAPAPVENLYGEVHQEGRSTCWIRGKYGSRIRVTVEYDEERMTRG